MIALLIIMQRSCFDKGRNKMTEEYKEITKDIVRTVGDIVSDHKEAVAAIQTA